MERRKFIASTVALATVGCDLIGSPSERPYGFLVKAGEARFGKHTPFMGVNPNDLKISSYEEFFQAIHDRGRPPSQEEAESISLAHGIKNVGPPLTL